MVNNDELQRRVLARLRAENQHLFNELLEREERTMWAERCRIVALPTTQRMRLGWYQRCLLSIQIPMAPITVGWWCYTCRRPTYAVQACVRGADAILASHLTPTERSDAELDAGTAVYRTTCQCALTLEARSDKAAGRSAFISRSVADANPNPQSPVPDDIR
ncbi:hypothetical protein KQX54_011246 [Cotesia glomerata]|uniref:Uncharacterized protein n=1 Tax=Cotesia glomerata TaxID=32391 RepID=A0AAV7HY64_COTGL|nr:hypothetical protein KQX54_011246 [Cotesia glomerata]